MKYLKTYEQKRSLKYDKNTFVLLNNNLIKSVKHIHPKIYTFAKIIKPVIQEIIDFNVREEFYYKIKTIDLNTNKIIKLLIEDIDIERKLTKNEIQEFEEKIKFIKSSEKYNL